MRFGSRVVVLCVLALGAGCGAPRICVPGKSEACIGPGGCAGGQRCSEDGTFYGACECSSPVGGGGGAVGGGGGSSGGGGGSTGGGGGDDAGATGGGGGSTGDDGGMGGGGGGGSSDAGQPDAGALPPPELELLPGTSLDLGVVPYFANATTPIAASARLTVRNLGTASSSLLLGRVDAGSQPPYWTVTALGSASATEVCVGSFDATTGQCTGTLPGSGFGSYSPTTGLAGGQALEIPVRVTPAGLGTRSFEVRLFTNDADEPVTTVTLTVNALSSPPCDVTVSPVALDFGTLGTGAQRELAIAVSNNAPDGGPSCLVLSPTVGDEQGRPAAVPPVFSVPPGPGSVELQPGETQLLPVRAALLTGAPGNPATVTGKARFFLARPTAPLVEVDLSATLFGTCLAITPGSANFGAWGPSCNATAKTFQLTNLCPGDVTINATSMALAGSAVPGSAACPGTAPCPEFLLTTPIPPGTRVMPGATPVSFAVQYRPLDLGADQGAFLLTTTEGTQTVRYVVPLRGAGATGGLNRETSVRGLPRADVLLVIDDSCSMGDKQTQLANHMSALLQHATLNQIDFQLGVTNTELSGGTAALAGTLHTSPGGHKILRPTTPNFATEFASLVRVGTSGYSESCLDPATRAVTAPNVSDPTKNFGFLRPDATLGIVCVTDARDQAVQPVSYYLGQLLGAKAAGSDLLTYSVMGPFLPSSPSGCSYDDPNDGRHDEAINVTGGAKEEICSNDWPAALTRIGEVAFGARQGRSYPLTARPDPMAPLTVTVNGLVVPELSPTPPNARYWTWDQATNRIVFEAYAQPPPGATVVVSYATACVP